MGCLFIYFCRHNFFYVAKMKGAEDGEVDCRVRIMRVRSGDQQVIC